MRLLSRIRRDESGSMLIELLVAMTVLTIAVGAMMTAYASSLVSLRHSGVTGTALTLADAQIEVYKTVSYTNVRLDASTIPGGSDKYVTANSTDPTIPSASGQVTGASGGAGLCTQPAHPQPQCAVQTVTGPDGRSYRVDSYITSGAPAGGGRSVKVATVIVREVRSGVVGTIRGRVTSAFDQASNDPPLG
jgi:type II secretory pathway pseudopilin PulG